MLRHLAPFYVGWKKFPPNWFEANFNPIFFSPILWVTKTASPSLLFCIWATHVIDLVYSKQICFITVIIYGVTEA